MHVVHLCSVEPCYNLAITGPVAKIQMSSLASCCTG